MLDKTSVLSFGVALPVIDEQRSEITHYTKQSTLLLADTSYLRWLSVTSPEYLTFCRNLQVDMHMQTLAS